MDKLKKFLIFITILNDQKLLYTSPDYYTELYNRIIGNFDVNNKIQRSNESKQIITQYINIWKLDEIDDLTYRILEFKYFTEVNKDILKVSTKFEELFGDINNINSNVLIGGIHQVILNDVDDTLLNTKRYKGMSKLIRKIKLKNIIN